MSIPKIVFTYWEGDQLSILHYYTILSLVKLNPNQKIIIYTSDVTSTTLIQWNSDEHSSSINNKVTLDKIISISNNIELIPISFEKEYNIQNNISVVYKADFIRIAKLYEHGGLWFDFDILFIKPLSPALFTDTDMCVFTYLDTIPTGLVSSTPKNKTITQLFLKAQEVIHNTLNSYQQLGPDLWRSIILHNSGNNVIYLDTSIAYPYESNVYHLFFNSNDDYVKDNTICIHWYNGGHHSKNFINNFDINIVDPYQCVCTKYIHMINQIKSDECN